MNRIVIFAAMFSALAVSSAVAIVYTTHLSRLAYIEISANQSIIDELQVEWSQLQIEESTFSEFGRIERAASEELRMSIPGLDESVMIVRRVPGS